MAVRVSFYSCATAELNLESITRQRFHLNVDYEQHKDRIDAKNRLGIERGRKQQGSLSLGAEYATSHDVALLSD